MRIAFSFCLSLSAYYKKYSCQGIYRLYKHLFKKNHIKILYIVTYVSFQMGVFTETHRDILHTLYVKKTANLEIGRAALPKWVEKLGSGLNKQSHKTQACFSWPAMHERPRVANLSKSGSQHLQYCPERVAGKFLFAEIQSVPRKKKNASNTGWLDVILVLLSAVISF